MKQKTVTTTNQRVLQRPITGVVIQRFSGNKETIIWTALPNGRTATKLKLSAHVTFHLAGQAEWVTLNLFKNAADWDVSGLKVYVKVGDQPEKLATVVSAPQYDKTLWKKFFSETGPVKSWGYVPKKTPVPMDTYHALGVGAYLTTIQAHQAMDGFYRAPTNAEQAQNPLVKQAAVDTPPAVPPAGPISRSGLPIMMSGKSVGVMAHQQSHAAVIAQKNANPSIIAARSARSQGSIPSAEHQIAEASHFTQPSESRVIAKSVPPTPPKMDFHQALATLSQHPTLMRMMGIVLDLEVDLGTAMPKSPRTFKFDASRTKVSAATVVPVSLRVEGMPHPEVADTHYPQTLTLLSSDKFMAAPRPFGKISGDIVDGFLDMNPSKVQVGNLDLQGGVMKMIMYAEGIQRRAQFAAMVSPRALASVIASTQPANSAAAPTEELYPAHRTSGISVYRVNRLALVQAVQAVSDSLHQDLTNSKPGADDIQLYSDDLFKGWRPDIQHKNKWYSLTQRVNTYQIGNKSFDAQDEGQTAASETKDAADGTTKLPESMFTWTGWSLVARKPGAPLAEDGTLMMTVPQTKADFTTWAGNPANLDKNYPMGTFAKPVDGSLPELRFGESYEVRARAVDLAGNSLPLGADHLDAGVTTHQQTLYLRQEPISSPTLFQTTTNALRGDSAGVLVVRKYLGKPTTQTAARVMVVPEGGENFAELHGILDDTTGKLDPTKYAVIAAVDARAKATGPLPNIISGDVPPLPYLPDPTALGATIRSGTGFVLPVLKASFYSSDHQWPNPLSGKITLAAATGATTTASVSGTNFTFGLLPGQAIELLMSSNTSHQWLGEFNQSWAVEQLLLEKGKTIVQTVQVKAPKAAVKVQSFKEHAAFGVQPRANMFVMPAALAQLRALRKPIVDVNDPSAIAQGFVDGLNYALTPYRKVKIVHATQVPEPGFEVKRFVASRSEGKTFAGLAFAGNVHTWSTGEVEFMATYTDPVDDLKEPQRKTKSVTKTNRAFTLAVPYNDTQAIQLIQDVGRHEFHDTKAHLIDYKMVAKTRYQEYFPSDWPKLNDPSTVFSTIYPMVIGKSGEIIVIPASQRPDTLPLEYIVPAFLWAKSDFQGKKVSAKKGNIFRIYLRRPWFSTGVGEKLAIILGPAIDDNDPNEELIERYTTRIGGDPIFINPPFVGAPGISNFPGAELSEPVALPELNGKQVQVMCYTPIFDDARQMWYVDIEVKVGGLYNPFVRLAMARYQQYSLPGLGLGPVTVADIMQLQTDRLAILEVAEPKKKIVLSMAGVMGRTKPNLPAQMLAMMPGVNIQNFVIATLERKTGDDPDTGWTPEIGGNGKPIEVPIPFLDENLAASIPAYIEGPKPVVKSRYAPIAVKAAGATPVATQKAQLMTAHAAERAGTINLPDQNATYRVVLREYEQHGVFPIDVEVAEADGRRLVHVDVIPVP